jgi:SAM-dependent methyltransferase
MNARVAPPPAPLASPADDARLAWLQASLAENRFLPAPPAESLFVGDGDFRAIGAEFLGHFVRVGGLRRTDRVLDIGCGIGRMAIPLTQYLDPETGSYEGVDPVGEGVAWCARTITPAYPRFRFCQVDVAHALYNPGGQLAGREVVLPFADGSFDFVAMVSVTTHLPLDEIRAYGREVMRLLSPGGRLFLTAFLVGEGDAEREGARPRFTPAPEPGAWYGDAANPLAATGFDPGVIGAAIEEAGLRIRRISLGHWRGSKARHYQDLMVVEKPGRRA